jgi:hypothetical protein
MTRLEPSSTIEATVGARRSDTEHLGRAVSDEQRVYVLHSAACVASGIDLRDCEYSQALDRGINPTDWLGQADTPVTLTIDPRYGTLVPVPAHDAKEQER